MRFGINTFLWTAHFGPEHLALLPVIREHGFDGVEMFVFDPAAVPAAAIRRGLEEAQMGCTFCTALGPGVSLADSDSAVRAKARQHVADCIRVVAEAGSHHLAGPVYTPLGDKPGRRRTQDEWKRVIEELQTLGDCLNAHDVTLCIEPLNRFETYFLNTAADSVALADAVNHPKVGILFDTFHANIEEKDVAAGFRLCGRHLKHVHVCENDRGTPGSGHVDWPGVFSALKEMNYDGWVTIESFGGQIQEIAAAACIWRDLAPTTESIAWDGIRFLRAHLP
ncbi:MAG: sugar phosphate isomerase/epimerase family protein [Bryobacteraceae bacterium]|nr:sugar phosphate isomerase/epimerase family protein [Bryobacteraceae bacterium]